VIIVILIVMSGEVSISRLFGDTWDKISKNFSILIPFIIAGIVNLISGLPFSAMRVSMPFSTPQNMPITTFRILFSPVLVIGYLLLSLLGIIIVYILEVIGYRAFYNYLHTGVLDFSEASSYIFSRIIRIIVAGIIAIILIVIVITIPLAYLMLAGIIVDDLDIIEALNRGGKIIMSNIGTFIVLTIIVIIIYAVASIIPFISPILTEIVVGYVGMVFILAYTRLTAPAEITYYGV